MTISWAGPLLASALLAFIPTAPAAGTNPSQQRGAETIANDDIVALVKAGLSEEIIIQKVRSTPGDFDLSTEGLIGLKAEGVSDAIIQAMLESQDDTAADPGGTEAPIPAAPDPPITVARDATTDAASGTDPMVPVEPGIYCVEEDGSLLFIEGKSPGLESGGGSMVVSALTFGIKKYKSYGVLRGTTAPTTLTYTRPRFLIRLNSGQAVRDFVLIELEQHRTERKYQVLSARAIVGSADYHLEEEAVVPVQFERVSPELYEVAVDRELAAGEYAFVDTGQAITEAFAGRVYDFSVAAR